MLCFYFHAVWHSFKSVMFLDPSELPEAKPKTKEHTWADSWSRHMYSRGLPRMTSVVEDEINPVEIRRPGKMDDGGG